MSVLNPDPARGISDAASISDSLGHSSPVIHPSRIRWQRRTQCAPDQINSLGDGRVVLQFDVDNTACLGTNSPKGYYVAVGQNGVTADGLKNILATAMLTQSQGKILSFYVDNSTVYCYISQVILIE